MALSVVNQDSGKKGDLSWTCEGSLGWRGGKDRNEDLREQSALQQMCVEFILQKLLTQPVGHL